MSSEASQYDQGRLNRFLEIAKEKKIKVEISYEKGCIYLYNDQEEIIDSVSLEEYRSPPPQT